jgi:hypothetical protein
MAIKDINLVASLLYMDPGKWHVAQLQVTLHTTFTNDWYRYFLHKKCMVYKTIQTKWSNRSYTNIYISFLFLYK